jgi:hypothetical protein
MKIRKVVFALVMLSFLVVGAASADMQCFPGVGWYDQNGNWHCSYSASGNCLFCADEIVVKG